MEFFNEKSRYLALYLISLYYKTNCKYPCSREHINMLLTIYTLCTRKYNPYCLEREFWISSNPDNNGAPFINVTLPAYIDVDVYSLLENNYSNSYIEEEFCETEKFINEFKPCYNDFDIIEHSIDKKTKGLLENIFRKFGNYSIQCLSKLQQEIRYNLPTKLYLNKTIIDNDKYLQFINSNSDNEILMFIKNHSYIEMLEKATKKNKVLSLNKKNNSDYSYV